MFSILIVDDEPSTLQLRILFLQEKGCHVDCVTTEEEALYYIAHTPYDCILLDVMLSETSGFSICSNLKKRISIPIIFLSHLSDDDSQLTGFLSGGVDYISKESTLSLFWAKVETRIQLSHKENQYMHFDPLTIDITSRKIYINKNELTLTSIEFDILTLLASKPGCLFPVFAIYRAVWGVDQWDQGQTVQVHMSHMRRKLEKAYPQHYFIETVWGKGYQFIPINAYGESKERTK